MKERNIKPKNNHQQQHTNMLILIQLKKKNSWENKNAFKY